MSERSHDCSNTRRRIFREQPLCRPLLAPGIDCHCGAGALRRGRIFQSASIQLFRGCLPLHFSSRFAPVAFSGRSCITPPMPNGRWWCGGNWKTSRCCWWCWRFFLCRSFSFGVICIPGWTSRPVSNSRLMRSAAYLNWSFFLVRAVVFFGFFIFASLAFAPLIGATGQGWKSTLHHLDAQGRVHQSADVRALSHLWRVRLADEPELSLVLHHVWRLHFRGRGRQLDVAARPGDHSLATGWLFEGYRHARALPHHGKMDAGLLRFLGLHRLQPVHAHLVCEHPGRDAVFSSLETPNRGGR